MPLYDAMCAIDILIGDYSSSASQSSYTFYFLSVQGSLACTSSGEFHYDRAD
jgi:hypothetical protein